MPLDSQNFKYKNIRNESQFNFDINKKNCDKINNYPNSSIFNKNLNKKIPINKKENLNNENIFNFNSKKKESIPIKLIKNDNSNSDLHSSTAINSTTAFNPNLISFNNFSENNFLINENKIYFKVEIDKKEKDITNYEFDET